MAVGRRRRDVESDQMRPFGAGAAVAHGPTDRSQRENTALASAIRNVIARGSRPSRRSTCHALVGLLTPKPSQNQAFSSVNAADAAIEQQWLSQRVSRLALGYSGGAVPDYEPIPKKLGLSHRIPCSSAARNHAADHQRTSNAANLDAVFAVVKSRAKILAKRQFSRRILRSAYGRPPSSSIRLSARPIGSQMIA
jgi:hypothetical protein